MSDAKGIIEAEAEAWKVLQDFQAKEKQRRQAFDKVETRLLRDWSNKYSAMMRAEREGGAE